MLPTQRTWSECTGTSRDQVRTRRMATHAVISYMTVGGDSRQCWESEHEKLPLESPTDELHFSTFTGFRMAKLGVKSFS